jgi:hypothetical protein
MPPYKHRPQHSSSSGEEGAFRPDSLAASRFQQLRRAPLIGAKAKGSLLAASLRACFILDTWVPGTTTRQFLCCGTPIMTLPSLTQAPHVHAGTNEDLAAAHHMAPSVAAELGDFHHPHADGSVVQTPAFNSIPAFRSGALQHSSIGNTVFRTTVAGSLGGIGPGFAGGSGAFGSPRYGAPGYTSSGYHGMQVRVWNNPRRVRLCLSSVPGQYATNSLPELLTWTVSSPAAVSGLLRHRSAAGILAHQPASWWR